VEARQRGERQKFVKYGTVGKISQTTTPWEGKKREAQRLQFPGRTGEE